MMICGLLVLLAANRLEGGVGLSSADGKGSESADRRTDAAIILLCTSLKSNVSSTVVFVYTCTSFVFSTNCHGNTL